MILVTGGAGYVGSVLVNELLSLGESVRVVDTLWFGNPFSAGNRRLEVIQADVRYMDRAWLDGVTSVVHLAGLSNDPTADFAPELNAQSNVLATRELGEAVADVATREQREIRFLLASTCSVYYSPVTEGDMNVQQMVEDLPIAPTANYSKTKRLAEIELLRLAERHRFFCPVILRKGTIFGRSPRMRFDLVVNTFTLHAWRNRMLTVHGHGEMWRPLLHVRDAADAYIHLLWAPTGLIRGETFNVVHKNYRVLELAHWVAETLNQHRHVDIGVKRDRSGNPGSRSYYVVGDRIGRVLGLRPERGTADAILEIWDGLERSEFGSSPEANAQYFNIRHLQATLPKAAFA